MNKGFILEGYPRTEADAKHIFVDKVQLLASPDEEPKFEDRVNDKIMPQYALYFEAEDSFLIQKAKELPPGVLEGTHWNDAGMNRRIKDYRAKNPESASIQDFFKQLIGPANVLGIDASKPEPEQLNAMKEIIEQKGKPCCINMITEADYAFLASLEKKVEKSARQSQLDVHSPAEGGEEGQAQLDEEQEVDQISMLIEQEEQQEKELQIQLEEAAKLKREQEEQ